MKSKSKVGVMLSSEFNVPLSKDEIEKQWESGIMTPGEKDCYVKWREEKLHLEEQEGEAAIYAFRRVLRMRRRP